MFIGIDIGGTHTRVATATSLADIVVTDVATCSTLLDFAAGIEEIVATIQSLSPAIDAIAIGVPGSVNDAGELCHAPNLPQWVHTPLQKTLAASFSCPVYIRNDAEMGALGEAYCGEAALSDFIYLTWGTGIGFAQVNYQDGVPLVTRPEHRQPVYDLEDKIGGKKLEARFGKPAKDLTHSEWEDVLADISTQLPELVRHYGFNTAVVGGGVATSLCPRLAFAKTLGKLDVEARLTNLGDQSGLYGAFSLLKEKQL